MGSCVSSGSDSIHRLTMDLPSSPKFRDIDRTSSSAPCVMSFKKRLSSGFPGTTSGVPSVSERTDFFSFSAVKSNARSSFPGNDSSNRSARVRFSSSYSIRRCLRAALSSSRSLRISVMNSCSGFAVVSSGHSFFSGFSASCNWELHTSIST